MSLIDDERWSICRPEIRSAAFRFRFRSVGSVKRVGPFGTNTGWDKEVSAESATRAGLAKLEQRELDRFGRLLLLSGPWTSDWSGVGLSPVVEPSLSQMLLRRWLQGRVSNWCNPWVGCLDDSQADPSDNSAEKAEFCRDQLPLAHVLEFSGLLVRWDVVSSCDVRSYQKDASFLTPIPYL